MLLRLEVGGGRGKGKWGEGKGKGKWGEGEVGGRGSGGKGKGERGKVDGKNIFYIIYFEEFSFGLKERKYQEQNTYQPLGLSCFQMV